MITFLRIGNLGRLANQMFQFSAVIGIARKNGFDPIFPIENFKTTDPHSFSGAKLLECFDIPSKYFSNSAKISRSVEFNYIEPRFEFDPLCLNVPDNANIDGYFQSEKYFIDSADEISKCFEFRDEIITSAEKNCNLIDFGNSVSVHVRRGDYLTSPNHHPTQKIDYYIDAFSKYPNSKKIIFSDDIEWCEENLSKLDDCLVIDEKNPYVTLYLMSNFKNHIISNSSFSWWGAWLSGSESKVIAPKNWFGPALPHNTKDLYPDHWTII